MKRNDTRGVITMFDNENGMTMVELLVVCVVISIAFMGLVAIFPLGMQNINDSRMRTVATDLAQERMEGLLDLRTSHADLNAGDHTDPDNPVRSTFNRFWSITDNTPVQDMKQIEVRVTYPHGSTTRDVTVVAYMRS
jgi:prepilin-type N-terminal cleavage/methylation domain-containing protein